MRIALIGGSKFKPNDVDKFLLKLNEKQADAIIITGEARGAEKHAAESARMLGFKVETLPLYEERFGKEAGLCQVNDIYMAAEIIVTMGSLTGGRVKRVIEIWHRLNMHKRDARGSLLKDKDGRYVSRREPWNHMRLVSIAIPEKEKDGP